MDVFITKETLYGHCRNVATFMLSKPMEQAEMVFEN